MAKVMDALEKARIYEKDRMVNDQTKPVFHVTAPVGWMNDPNGFSTYRGQVHLFYQYHPYSTQWGPMHWGHLVSDDFIRWEALPCALAPDTEADSDGCFSGSALEHEGKHILMYTGVAGGRQAQCIAVGDGINYEKLPENPVIDIHATDFRDPKIYRDGDCYRAVIAHRAEDGSGELLEYISRDLKTWEPAGVLDCDECKVGKMWECPNLFQLDGKPVIMLSIMETEANGRELHPGNTSVYLVRQTDGQRDGTARSIDYGLDFYAPQTMETPDGRCIMIAWAQSWENHLTPKEFRYSGIMTVPRELSLHGNRLRQVPVRELDSYLRESAQPNRGRVFDLRIEAETSDWFSVRLASDGKRYTVVHYDYIRNTLTVDRTCSGSRRDALHSRMLDVRNRNGKINLRILMDRYIMEVFVNDGEQAFTCLLYTPLDCDGIEYDGNQYTYKAVKYDISIKED